MATVVACELLAACAAFWYASAPRHSPCDDVRALDIAVERMAVSFKGSLYVLEAECRADPALPYCSPTSEALPAWGKRLREIDAELDKPTGDAWKRVQAYMAVTRSCRIGRP